MVMIGDPAGVWGSLGCGPGYGTAGPAARRRLLIDLTPLRRSRDLRCLVAGQLLSTLGAQLTTVAVPYQVYLLTRSSLDVGLVSLATVLPLIAGALLGGSLVDAVDRRKILLMARQSLTPLCSAGLAVNADAGTALWPLFALPGDGGRLRGGTAPGASPSCRTWSAGPRWPPSTPCSRRCSSSARSQARPWPDCCSPGQASASSTGWTWRLMAAAIAATFLMRPQARRRAPATGPACAPSWRASASCAAGRSSRALT